MVLNGLFDPSFTAGTKRSPTQLEFYACITGGVRGRLWPLKGLLLCKATRQESRKTNSMSTERTSRKSLFQDDDIPRKSSGKKEWTEAETSALDQYICLFWDGAGDKWSMHHPTFGMAVPMQF